MTTRSLAHRVEQMFRLGSREAVEKADACRAAGVDVLRIVGAPVGDPGPNVLEAVEKASHAPFMPPSLGHVPLREAIAAKLERENAVRVDPDNVIVTNGAMQALYVIMTAFLDPGDEVVMFSPVSIFNGIVELVGGRCVYVPTSEEEMWRFDPAAFEKAITPRTKLAIVHTPANPTGYMATRKELEALAAVVERHGLPVISDESYEKFTYDGRKHVSFASLPGMDARTFTVQSFTKSYSMQGYRLGYLAGPPRYMERLKWAAEWMVLAVNYSSQVAGHAALTGPQAWVRNIQEEFALNRRTIMNGLEKTPGLRFVPPQGGPYVFVNVLELGDSDAVADFFLREYGVLSTPGPTLISPPHIRLPFGGTPDTIREVARRLQAGADAWRAGKRSRQA